MKKILLFSTLLALSNCNLTQEDATAEESLKFFKELKFNQDQICITNQRTQEEICTHKFIVTFFFTQNLEEQKRGGKTVSFLKTPQHGHKPLKEKDLEPVKERTVPELHIDLPDPNQVTTPNGTPNAPTHANQLNPSFQDRLND
jgi:hypothetical protein